MADHGRLAVELADDGLGVVSDLAERLAGEHLGVLVRLLDGVGVVGPVRGHGGVAGLLENCPPPVPAAGEQPQTVDEHHRGKPGSVCPVDLVLFVFADVCHACSLFLRSRGMRSRAVEWW